jgi:hypothetical protein
MIICEWCGYIQEKDLNVEYENVQIQCPCCGVDDLDSFFVPFNENYYHLLEGFIRRRHYSVLVFSIP